MSLALAAAALLLALRVGGVCSLLGPCAFFDAPARAPAEAMPSCHAHAAEAPAATWEARECCHLLTEVPAARAAAPRPSIPPALAVAETPVPARVEVVAQGLALRRAALRHELLPGRRCATLLEIGVLLL